MEKTIAVLFVIALLVAISAFGALLFYWLWNWLIPDLIGLRALTFYESWGLCVLMGLIGNMLFKNSN